MGAAEVETCPYKSIGGRASALWRTMIADYAGDGAVPDEDWAYIETWYDRVGWAKEVPSSKGLNTWEVATANSDFMGAENQMFEHFIRLRPLNPPLAGFRETSKWSAKEPGRIKKQYGTYMRRIHRACAHRALFVTKRGYIGLAPWNARAGDEVAILYGGQTPYLLRRSVMTGYHALVGEAYVYGMMAGEALADDVAQQGPHIIHIA